MAEIEESQQEEFASDIDWRGFTEQDFENLQAGRKNDPRYEFNHHFYAGDLKISLGESWDYSFVDISLWTLKNGGTPEASLQIIMPTNLQFDIGEIKEMTYEDFQHKLESHLNYVTKSSKYLTDEEKSVLAENMSKPAPKSWAYKDLHELTEVSKHLIHKKGNTLDEIEKLLQQKNHRKRQNVLLHGGSKNLMKKLIKELEKDKEIKKILSAQKGR